MRQEKGEAIIRAVPPHVYFIVSAVFHYLGPGVRRPPFLPRVGARGRVAAHRHGGRHLCGVAQAMAGPPRILCPQPAPCSWPWGWCSG